MRRYIGLLWTLLMTLLFVLPTGAQDAPAPVAVGLAEDAPPYALHGPYWVGTTEVMLEDSIERPLALTIWYPALNPAGAEESVEYVYYYPPVWAEQAAILGRALRDAAPDIRDAAYPLVIFSHAMGMYRTQSSYLTEHLASYGFVVVALDHWQSTPEFAEGPPFVDYVYRPLDFTRAIDFAVTLNDEHERLAGMIDIDKIAVVGMSSGGLAALQAVGARLNLDEMRASCQESTSDGWPWFCLGLISEAENLAQLAGLDAVPEGAWPSGEDARVDAIVPIVPGARLFDSVSLASLTTPTLILVGTQDVMLDPEYHARYVYESLTSTPRGLITLEGAGHFFGIDSCSRVPFFVSAGLEWLCSDPAWDMDRAHDLINHFTTAFLLDMLKGDANAHAALAPNAVSFPGITYEAQGF